MRKPLAWLATAAFALVLAVPTAAQETPQYVQLSTLEFAPGEIEPFLEQVKTVRDAAEEIGLSSEFAWSAYRWENTLIFASWPENMASLDDPNAMMAAFQGTPVESRVMQAFQRAEGAQILEGVSEILITHSDHSYQPENSAVADGSGAIYVFRQWVKGGQREAFLESVDGFMGMLAEAGGTYPVSVHEGYIGTGGFHIVVGFDDPVSFYGENSMENLIMNSDIGADWQAHAAKHAGLLSRSEAQMYFFLPDHSYMPDEDS
jgi:hypothetical protein